MSTLKVDTITDSSSGLTTTINGFTPKTDNMAGRNLIINGAMNVAQRGTSSTGTGYRTVDRFGVNQTNFDNLVSTKTQDTNAPVGFSKSLKIATTTVETALAADEYGNMSYAIEAQDLQRLAYGTSSAKSFTLSFYVKSNLTGNFSVTAYKQTGSDKLQDRRYTINTANTWERKTLTFVGDTAQSIVNDTTVGIYLYWHTAFGSNYGTATYNASAGWSAYANAGWGAGQDINTLYNSTSNYIQFTGVQLEVGDTATPFDYRSFGEELSLCQRYHYRIVGNEINNLSDGGFGIATNWDTNTFFTTLHFPVQMRAGPSFSFGAALSDFLILSTGATAEPTGISLNGASKQRCEMNFQKSGGFGTAGYSGWLRIVDNTNGFIAFDSEL